MKQFDKIWIVWLVLVCIWNFGWKTATPFEDVLVAAILSVLAFQYKNYKK